MSFCLPKPLAAKFREAMADGSLSVEKLGGGSNIISSEERRAILEPIVGAENVHEVNALLESKLLMKDQNRALATAARQILGEKSPALRDALSTINRMEKVLTPESRDAFLEDLVSKKLGANIDFDDLQKITDLSRKATLAREAMKGTVRLSKERIAFGRSVQDLTEFVNSLKPETHGATWWASELLSLPKTALTGVLHFSAPFVQGWGMMSTTHFWKGVPEMMKYFAKEDNFKDMMAGIISDPYYDLAKSGQLGLTELGDKLTTQEEEIYSRSLLEKAFDLTHSPVNPIRASSRGFVGFLNYVRFNRFVDLVNAAQMRGENVNVGSQTLKDLAAVVNNFTGRGELGKNDRYASFSPVLNSVFFSPRKIMGTVKMFDPRTYLDPRISKTAKIAATRQLAGSLIVTGAMWELANLSGAKVVTNPTDKDFGKIEFGKTKLDMTGSNAIYVRLLARLITNSQTSGGKTQSLGEFGMGKPAFGGETGYSEVIGYFRGKLAPVAGTIADALYGKDQGGNIFNAKTELANDTEPIFIQEFMEMAQSGQPNMALWLPTLAAMFGVQVSASKK